MAANPNAPSAGPGLDTLEDALALKDYTYTKPDGLSGRPYMIKREQLVDGLLRKADEMSLVMLEAPPGSGKTSILQLVFWHANKLKNAGHTYKRVVYFNATECEKKTSWEDFVFAKLGETWSDLTGSGSNDQKVLILIDDIESLDDRDNKLYETLWNTITSVQRAGSSSRQAGSLQIMLACVYRPSRDFHISKEQTVGLH